MRNGEHEHRCTKCPRTWTVGVCEHERCVTDCREFFGRHLDARYDHKHPQHRELKLPCYPKCQEAK